MTTTTYLDKRKIASIERQARDKTQISNGAGRVLAGAILAAFVISTVHLMANIRGGGFLGWTLGLLSSVATEGAFIWHRYISYPRHENTTQKWAALIGLTIALLGSLAFFTGDMLLLLGLLPLASVGAVAVGVMIALLMSAIVTESVYELASHVAGYERQKRSDALEILKTTDTTRLELDRGDLEILKANSELVLAELFQRAETIRKAIPQSIGQSKPETIKPDEIRDQLFNFPIPAGGNGNGPKVPAR